MNIALAIIQHPTDETILIAQRKPDVPLANFWEFPGGKCLPGESLPDCVVRETWEEVGISIRIIEAWPSIVHAYPGHTVCLYPFFCRAETADALPLDSQRIAWIAPRDLKQYQFPEANMHLLDRLQRMDLIPSFAL